MRTLVIALTVMLVPCSAWTEDAQYQGSWHTTNRKLDGTMQCTVKDLGNEKWEGRFYGVWQGVPFDYTVAFSGPAPDVRGTAIIDSATYTWSGQISYELPKTFKGSFGGSRYTGHFDLKETGRTVSK